MASTAGEPVIEFENLSHSFGKFHALRGLSLTINRGDIYGLLGLNGAGKTTSIRILLGLLRPSSGSVLIFGKSRSTDWFAVAGRIGATIEAPAFYPHLSGLTNLRLLDTISARRPGSRTPEQAIELVGLADAARVKVGKYSQGMQQRLYLAQALLARPEILVLDEPTSNLDPRGIMDVRLLIQRLNREEGMTILLSSHQLSEVEDLCNRVAIINRGRKIVESTVTELLATEECWLSIHSDRSEDAVQVLNNLPWCAGTTLNGESLRTRVLRSRRAELNSLLVREGFSVSEFSEQRPTLEDFFHQKVSEDVA